MYSVSQTYFYARDTQIMQLYYDFIFLLHNTMLTREQKCIKKNALRKRKSFSTCSLATTGIKLAWKTRRRRLLGPVSHPFPSETNLIHASENRWERSSESGAVGSIVPDLNGSSPLFSFFFLWLKKRAQFFEACRLRAVTILLDAPARRKTSIMSLRHNIFTVGD